MRSVDQFESVAAHRSNYLSGIKESLIARAVYRRRQKDGIVEFDTYSVADTVQELSSAIARRWVDSLPGTVHLTKPPHANTIGSSFEVATQGFLAKTLKDLRPHLAYELHVERKSDITKFDQYAHLAVVANRVAGDVQLRAAFGADYVVRPDIVVFRKPVDSATFGYRLADSLIGRYSPLFYDAAATPEGETLPQLHASVSCKFTIRSDRAQNTRTEALNLVRNRKGAAPHIVAVTAEPLPSRLESLALGTGDIDCVYHVALPELIAAVSGSGPAEVALGALVEGRRLRDISDLPFDLIA